MYSFHSSGNFFFLPFQGKYPNTVMTSAPYMHKFFSEIVQEAEIPKDMQIGSAPEVLYEAGGDFADWVASDLGIPAAENEIGARKDFPKFVAKDVNTAFNTCKTHFKWIEYTM